MVSFCEFCLGAGLVVVFSFPYSVWFLLAAHLSLDEYLADWFGLNQSKYQWALNDYYESSGKVNWFSSVFLSSLLLDLAVKCAVQLLYNSFFCWMVPIYQLELLPRAMCLICKCPPKLVWHFIRRLLFYLL